MACLFVCFFKGTEMCLPTHLKLVISHSVKNTQKCQTAVKERYCYVLNLTDETYEVQHVNLRRSLADFIIFGESQARYFLCSCSLRKLPVDVFLCYQPS